MAMIGWAENKSYDIVLRSEASAECLIELLEVADCGSIGGFDKGQEYRSNLFERWDWLIKKYHRPSDFKDYAEIKKFFST